jgi:hypothetical protein
MTTTDDRDERLEAEALHRTLAAKRRTEEAQAEERIVAGDALAELLIRAGHGAVRGQILEAIGALASIPPDAFDAVIRWTEQAGARLKANPDPRAAEAGRNLTGELEVMRAARTFRRRLTDLSERHEARDRIIAP